MRTVATPVRASLRASLRAAVLGLAAAVAATTVAGCGFGHRVDTVDAGPDVTSGIRAVPAVAKLLPPGVRQRQQLTIATSAPYAPMEFFDDDNKTLIGFDVDVGNAIGRVLGVKVVWKTVAFDAVVPGLQAGRYDLGLSGFSIEPDRLKVVDFVSYYLSGGSFMVKAGRDIGVSTFDQLCGYRVAVLKGASQVDSLVEADRGCRRRGRTPITILQIPDQNAAALALVSGRADVLAADKPQIEYQTSRSKGKLCVSGSYRTLHSIAGVAVPKQQAALLKPVQAAVNQLLRSGDYQRIAKKWGTGVRGAEGETTPAFRTLAASWGVGPDGAVRTSKVFTEPAQIRPGHRVFAMPVERGCGS